MTLRPDWLMVKQAVHKSLLINKVVRVNSGLFNLSHFPGQLPNLEFLVLAPVSMPTKIKDKGALSTRSAEKNFIGSNWERKRTFYRFAGTNRLKHKNLSAAGS